MSSFLATAGTIAVAAGGSFCGMDHDDRLRFYALAIGDNGTGKETAISGPDDIISAVVHHGRSMGNFYADCLLPRVIAPSASPEGLEDRLKQNPDLIVTWDEIAQDLKDMEAGKIAHKAGFLNRATLIFSKAHKVYHTRDKAKEAGETITAPSVTIVGATVEEKFADAITSDYITDGRGARILMFPVNGYCQPLRRRASTLNLPPDAINAIIKIAQRGAEIAPGDRNRNPHRITYTNEADDLFFAVSEEQDSKPPGSVERALASRMAVNAKAFACIRALVNNPEKPMVTLEIAQWAIWLVRYSDLYKLRLVGERVSFGEHDKAQASVLERLRKQHEKTPGKWVSRKALTNDSRPMRRLKGFERDSILKELEKNGQIEARESDKSWVYRLVIEEN